MFRPFAYILISLALVGWVMYQLLSKKKAFKDIFNEVLFILFLVLVWAAIYYWALR